MLLLKIVFSPCKCWDVWSCLLKETMCSKACNCHRYSFLFVGDVANNLNWFLITVSGELKRFRTCWSFLLGQASFIKSTSNILRESFSIRMIGFIQTALSAPTHTLPWLMVLGYLDGVSTGSSCYLAGVLGEKCWQCSWVLSRERNFVFKYLLSLTYWSSNSNLKTVLCVCRMNRTTICS